MPTPLRRKRIHHTALFTEEELRAAYKVYTDAGLSCYDLGRQLWQKQGYKDAVTCANALRKAFASRAWKLRSRSESRKLALKLRGYAVTEEQKREKRRERYVREMGRPYQPRCASTRYVLRTKKRCSHPAMIGSDVCAFHAPPNPERQCEGTNKAGVRCGRMKGSHPHFCHRHRPKETA